MPFEQAREEIGEPRVHRQAQGGVRQVSRASCAPQAIIEWKNAEMKKAYEAGRRSRQEPAAGAIAGGIAESHGARLRPAAQWFALWTRSRHEQVVREQLEQKQIDAFLPTIPKWSRWKDRKKKIDWPLFPGYCFARFDPADTLPILKCTGVVNIVSFEGKPAPIPELRARQHPAARRQRPAVRSVSADPRRA